MAESYDFLKDQLAGLQKKYFEVEALNQNLNERLLELYSLYQINLTLSTSLDLKEIVKSFKKLFQKTLRVDHFGLFLLDESLVELSLHSYFGLPKKSELKTSFKFGEDIFGKALELREIIYAPDMKQEKNFNFFSGDLNKGAFIVVPVLVQKKQPIGVISLQRSEINSFSENEISLLKKIGNEIANVLDKTLLYKHTKELAITDDLTGLYNRRYFNQRFDREFLRAKRYKRPLTILMIDIDYFKNYNDINGHILGDEVLIKVASLLESNLRKADIVARYGGEEFVILLPEIDNSHADQVAEKLRHTIEKNCFPREVNQPKNRLTISIGLATFPKNSANSKELIELADRALYKAKEEGRNRVVAYHHSFDENRNIIQMQPKIAAAGE